MESKTEVSVLARHLRDNRVDILIRALQILGNGLSEKDEKAFMNNCAESLRQKGVTATTDNSQMNIKPLADLAKVDSRVYFNREGLHLFVG